VQAGLASLSKRGWNLNVVFPCRESQIPSRFADVVKDMKGVTPKDLALDIGVPFHPGALKYFKEIGAL